MIPVILVVDDDPSILELVRYNLTRLGYRVLATTSGQEGLLIMETTPIDLLIVDLTLTELSGFDLCWHFRRKSWAPVIVLTGRHGESDRLGALEAGADDYLTKPFSPTELLARVRAHLRRWSWQGNNQAVEEILTVGPLTLDLAGHRAFFKGDELRVTPTEFDILCVLCRAPGRVFPRERLLALATGQEVVGSARTVDVHIRSLRLKFEADPAHPVFLETVRGSGYCIGRNLIHVHQEGSV